MPDFNESEEVIEILVEPEKLAEAAAQLPGQKEYADTQNCDESGILKQEERLMEKNTQSGNIQGGGQYGNINEVCTELDNFDGTVTEEFRTAVHRASTWLRNPEVQRIVSGGVGGQAMSSGAAGGQGSGSGGGGGGSRAQPGSEALVG